MTTAEGRDRQVYRGPAFFSYGFRPFFLGAAVFAGLAVPAWLVMLADSGEATLPAAARQWHMHEMVFGFLPAVITGFALTAIPNWTDRPPIRGPLLIALFALWLAGRPAMALSTGPHPIVALVDAAFLVAVAAVVWREIAAGGSWDRAPIGVLISLYAVANVFFHVRALGGEPTDDAIRLGLALVMVLLALIGGRVTPTFTEELLSQQGRAERPAPFSRLDGLALVLLVLAAASWTVDPQTATTGWLLLAAGLVHGVRLGRWRGWTTWREPLVLVLHLGYGWLALALLLLGAAVLGVGLAPEDAVHALTTGAVGVMTLGVMTRASLGHTGRPRHADPPTVAIYTLVTIGALVRVVGPATALPPLLVLGASALFWSGAYLAFAVLYGPYLLAPSLDE